MAPTVSVITPLYNSGPFIERTLESLRRQSYSDWESILVNDGSTDDTREKIEPFLADARFTYVEQRNGGIAAARNTGLTRATGEWVCLLDHDDRWMPEKLERQLAFATTNAFDIVCTNAIAVQEKSRKLYSSFYAAEFIASVEHASAHDQPRMFELLSRHNFLCASSVMIRRSLLDKAGFFRQETAPADDYDLWLRCVPHGRVGYLSEPLIEYFIHGANSSHDFVRMMDKTIDVLHESSARHRHEPNRLRPVQLSLMEVYRGLLTDLIERRQYANAARRLLNLARREPRGMRLVYWTVDGELRRAFRRSLTHRSDPQRSIFGEHNLDERPRTNVGP